MSAFAQLPFAWGASLPDDYKDNPYARQEIKAMKVIDDDVTGADNLEAIWGTIGDSYVNAVDAKMGDFPDQAAADFTGKFALLAGEDALYVMFNVIDDDWDQAADKCEIVFSHQDGAYDIDPAIIGADSLSAPWKYDFETHDYKGITKDVLHDMGRYGLWSSEGDVKLGGIPATTNEELYAPTMYFESNYNDTTDAVTMKIKPNFGSTGVLTPTYAEAQTGGYIMLVVMPWELMNDNVQRGGDKMSIAVQLKDNTSDADSTYVYWGGTTENNVYWGVRYYGAIAEIIGGAVTGVDISLTTASVDVGETVQVSATVNPDDANDKSVTWSSSDEAIATVDATGLITGVAKGLADITVTTNDGSFTAVCNVNVGRVSIEDVNSANIKVYYANNELVIPNNVNTVTIYNITGAKIKTLINPVNNIDVSTFTKGMYIAIVQTKDGKTGALKFIK